jgi:hypothetical protein
VPIYVNATECSITPNLHAALLQWTELRPYSETMCRPSLYSAHILSQRNLIEPRPGPTRMILMYVDSLLSRLQRIVDEKGAIEKKHDSFHKFHQWRCKHESELDEIRRRWNIVATTYRYKTLKIIKEVGMLL